MILTWFRLWPLLGLPFFVTFLLGLMPTFQLLGKHEFGGFLIREAFLTFTQNLLPDDKFRLLQELYHSGDYLTQMMVHGVLALNLNTVLLPFLYFIGTILIFVTSWVATTELDIKTKIARR